MTYTPYNPTRSSNFRGGPAMPYGVDPALQPGRRAKRASGPITLAGSAPSARIGAATCRPPRTRLGCNERKETDDPRIRQPIFPGRVRPQGRAVWDRQATELRCGTTHCSGTSLLYGAGQWAGRLAWGLTARATACNSTRNTRRRAGRSRLNARCRPQGSWSRSRRATLWRVGSTLST